MSIQKISIVPGLEFYFYILQLFICNRELSVMNVAALGTINLLRLACDVSRLYSEVTCGFY